MLSAENWHLKVKDKVYGPYTTRQMRKFAHQGRLASWSLISPAGSLAWREAVREPAFANLFSANSIPADPPEVIEKAFGKRAHETAAPANDSADDASIRIQTKRRRPAADAALANFIVVFDVVSAAASRVEAPILSLGPAFRIADNVWTVTCELTAIGVLNAIAPYLRSSEPIFVVDATRGRSAWRNYSPETASKISAAYLKARVA